MSPPLRSVLFVAAFCGVAHAAPLPSPGEPNSHAAYASLVKSAGDAALEGFVANYDAYLARFPQDAGAAVERCKLLAAALPSDDDGQEPVTAGNARLQTMNVNCAQWLAERFPDAKEALLYRLELKWGAEATAFGEQLLARRAINWTTRDRAQIYAVLARQLSPHDDQAAQASDYADRAMTLDHTIDLSTIVARKLLAEGRKSEAVALLNARTDSSPYMAITKARLLSDGGAPAHALSELDRLAQEGAFDTSLRAALLERIGKLDQAREVYLGTQHGTAMQRTALAHVLSIDLARNDARQAEQSYRVLRDLGWRTDPLLGHRLVLARRFPSLRWSGRDVLGLLRLIAALLVCVLLPLAWVAPLHYWSLSRRIRGLRPVDPALDTRWSFVHLWGASAIFLVVQLLSVDLLAPSEVASWFSATTEHVPVPPPALAAVALWNAALLTLGLGLLLVRPRDLKLFGRGSWSIGRYVGMTSAAVGILIGVAILYFGLFRAVSLARNVPHGALAPEDFIRALYQTHGVLAAFVVAVVVAPVTEELVFRSVMLDTVARYMRFWPANIVQAAAFAAAHVQPSRFPYLLAMGLLAGWLRRRSGGLLPSITLHAVNNAVVVLALIVTASPGANARPHAAPPMFIPSRELVECAFASHALALPTTKSMTGAGPQEAQMLNNVAWTLAIDPAITLECLARASEAANGALRQIPEQANHIDTEATVYFRQGRLDEAVELERRAIGLRAERPFYSQLDRFLKSRGEHGGATFIGNGARGDLDVSIAAAPTGTPHTFQVKLGGGFKYGGELYARVVGRTGSLGLLRASFGWQHAPSYEIALPSDVPDDVRIELALVDARGCDECAPAGWRSDFQPHDHAIDALPSAR